MPHALPVPEPGGTPAWRTPPLRDRILPLTISIVAHALAGLLLLARTGLRTPAPSPPTSLALEIELLPDSRPTSAPPVDEPRALPRPRPARVPARRAPPAAPTVAQPDPAAPPPPAGERPRPPLSLALDFRALDRLAQKGVLGPGEASPLSPGPPRPRPSTFGERLATRAREAGARRNVALGRVHPQVFDYLRDAHRVFAPDPTVVDLDPRAPNTIKNSLRQWGGGLAEAYRSWRRDLDDNRRRDDDPDRRNRPDILEHYNRILEGNRKGAEGIETQVCLLVQPGATPQVELGQTSGNQEVDRAAIDALTRASHRRQSELDLKKQRACYSFVVQVVRVPPLAVAGCTFDEVGLTATCYYPLQKSMVMSVSLDSIDYDVAR